MTAASIYSTLMAAEQLINATDAQSKIMGGVGAVESLISLAVVVQECGSEAKVGCNECFAAGTPIHTDHGDVAIENIHEGDEVLARDNATGKQELQRVTALTPLHKDSLLDMRIEGEHDALRPSTSHPFWVKRGDAPPAWIPTGEMRVGDLVQSLQGNWRRVVAITPLPGQETVFNFTVDKNHDYFVGQTGFLVHNEECPICQPTWPDNVPDMNNMLGFPGIPKADGLTTIGRNKTIWKLAKNVVLRFEKHDYPPYCNGGPRETNMHWQINDNGTELGKWMPGEPIPTSLPWF
jgi:hypothetical protein